MRIIAGFLLAALGAVMTIKAEWMYQSFGSIGTFEKFQLLQTSGGSRFFYKLLGIIFAIIGILMVANMHTKVIIWMLRPIFGQWFDL